MKRKFKLVLLVFALMLAMISCEKTGPITLPNANDSQVITVTKIRGDKEGPAVSIASKKDTVDMTELIQEKAKPTEKQSNNDTPANIKDLRKMKIFYGEDEKITLYLYQSKKLYIEKLYEGVWEIDSNTFNKLIGVM